MNPGVRVLLVTHYYSTHRGGVEAVAHRLAAALAASGAFAIEWMASDCDPAPPGIECIPARSWNGIERVSGLPFPLWSPAAIADLRRAVRRCDVVHIHDSLYMGNVLAAFFARRQGKPLVVTQHIGAIPYRQPLRALLSLLNRTLARWVLSRADRVVFISPAVQRYFAGFCPFRAAPAYIPNGVDTELFSYADAPRGRERPLCLFVGRFVNRKGLDIVLSVARQRPEVDWILAGDGPLTPELDAPENLSVLRGRTGKDIAALYQMADLLVLPSRGEGFPLVVQEAMACGTPALVGTDTAEGCPALAPHLFTEAVEGEDAPQRWSRRVAELLREPGGLQSLRPKVSAAARAMGSWPAVAQAYAAIFRR